MATSPPALMQMLTGFWVFQVVYVAVKLGVPAQLSQGPANIETLARQVQASPDSLYRVLRAISSIGILAEGPKRTFALTPVSEVLCPDHPESMHSVVLMLGEQNYPAWGRLHDAVKFGGSAFELAFGLPAYQYFEQNDAANEVFNAAMTALVRHDQAAVAEVYDFSRFQCVVDVGGGQGQLLATILRRHPGPHGILFDLPQVIQEAGATFEGISDRCELVAGNFFESVVTGGDAYVLSHIMHTFKDELCVQILRNVHQAMPPDGTLLIVEDILEPGNNPATAKTKFMDVNMLVLTPGGREHTRAEFEALFTQSGFRLLKTWPTPGGTTVLEAVKA